MARGHVELRVSLTSPPKGGMLEINEAMLAAYLEAFREACAKHGLSSPPNLNAALRVPGMLQAPAVPEREEDFEARLIAAVEEALGLLNSFREREGEELAGDPLASRASPRGRPDGGDPRAGAPLFQARLIRG
jgi:uncharacterized protein YicC (UPF0701 family)